MSYKIVAAIYTQGGIMLVDQESWKPEASMKQHSINNLVELRPKIVQFILILLLLVITIVLSAGIPLLTRSSSLL